MEFKNNSKKGFTIAEVLVGIVVIALTITSITFLVVDTISANAANMRTFQASQLSQEGLELVRNMRDSNWIRNLDWLGSQENNREGAYFALNFAKTNNLEAIKKDPNLEINSYYYTVDHSPNFEMQMGSSEFMASGRELPWKIKSIGKSDLLESGKLYECDDVRKPIFVHDSEAWGCTNQSLFTRYIVIEPYELDEYGKNTFMIRVRSVTQWQGRNGLQSVELLEDMTDWRRSSL